mmetsp:Transcript_1734/g.6837  ORF Transcript_1734/g.6837 Transcript_1734/m.6837 type:complete len:218 (+) Transcript_1734:2682-3335(+)
MSVSLLLLSGRTPRTDTVALMCAALARKPVTSSTSFFRCSLRLSVFGKLKSSRARGGRQSVRAASRPAFAMSPPSDPPSQPTLAFPLRSTALASPSPIGPSLSASILPSAWRCTAPATPARFVSSPTWHMSIKSPVRRNLFSAGSAATLPPSTTPLFLCLGCASRSASTGTAGSADSAREDTGSTTGAGSEAKPGCSSAGPASPAPAPARSPAALAS